MQSGTGEKQAQSSWILALLRPNSWLSIAVWAQFWRARAGMRPCAIAEMPLSARSWPDQPIHPRVYRPLQRYAKLCTLRLCDSTRGFHLEVFVLLFARGLRLTASSVYSLLLAAPNSLVHDGFR